MKKMFERMKKQNMLFAYVALAVMFCFAAFSGGLGLIGAVGIAMALPAMTDEESAFLETVKSEIAKAQEKYNKDFQ